MVIACSKCQTRFHVEDARVPEAGVRVRCSKCKHAFFVRPLVPERHSNVRSDGLPYQIIDQSGEAILPLINKHLNTLKARQ